MNFYARTCCFFEVYIISKCKTFPSPLRKEKNMNVNSHLLENLYEIIMRAWPWIMWNLVYHLKFESPIHFWTEHIGLTNSEVWLFELSPHALCNTKHPVLQYFHVYSLSIQSVFIVNLIIKFSEYIILNYSTFENGPNTKFKY